MAVRITIVDGMYKASRITGPKHNYLGLVLSAAPVQSPVILRRTLNNEATLIDEERMLAAVRLGVERANQSAATPLYFSTVEYVLSDTPAYSTYSELAQAIVAEAIRPSGTA